MSTIRQTFGLAGFPKRDESVHDAFGVGHSSTSISAGLGINSSFFFLIVLHFHLQINQQLASEGYRDYDFFFFWGGEKCLVRHLVF